ncbi:MAG: hypothetical protein R2932_14535 [Caldilineaceae bacterium]
MVTVFALTLQFNRQESIWQEAGLNQLAHDLVYHSGELARQQSALLATINSDPLPDAALLDWYRAKVNAQLAQLVLPANQDAIQQDALQPATDLLEHYRIAWAALQPKLNLLVTYPQNQPLRYQLRTQLQEMDRLLVDLVQTGQQLFDTRLQDWVQSLHHVNRLLTGATIVLLVVILMVSYILYLFVTMHWRVEATQRTSAQRLQTLLNTIPDAVLRLKSNGRIVDQKPAQQMQPFIHAAPYVGATLGEIVPPPVAQLLESTAAQAFATGEPQTVEYELEAKWLNSSQAVQSPVAAINPVYTFEARFFPTSTDEIQLLVRDITKEKQVDVATLQAQKLESIGMLAGGIAHDFNNILAGLLAQATLAKRKLETGKPVLANIDKVILSAERAADLTRQLLAYAGRGQFQVGPLDLIGLIEDTVTLLETNLTGRAQLRLHLCENLPALEADRGQLQQVVMNLVINAVEASKIIRAKWLSLRHTKPSTGVYR